MNTKNAITNKKISLGLTAILLTFLCFSLPLLALPAFRYGWYSQIESLTGGLWIMGSMAFLWNLFLLSSKPKLAQRVYSLPLVWGWIPLIALGLISALFQPAPLHSLTSNPQLADGILTFLSLMALSPVFLILRRLTLSSTLKALLLGVPTLIILLSSILTILGALGTPVPSLLFWKWAPLMFPDYITFYILSLAVIYGWLRPRLPHRKILDIFYGLTLAVLTYYAKNATILLGLCLAIGTYAILNSPLRLFWSTKPYAIRLALCGGLGLLTLTLLICLTNHWENPPSALSSIVSRAHIGQFTFLNYLTGSWNLKDIWTFLMGHGWGDYNNAAVANLTLPHDFALYRNGADNATIEFAYRDQVNSHNVFLEYFRAVGLVGLSVFLFVYYKIIQCLRPSFQAWGTFFFIAYGTMLVFWFQTPHSYIYTTFALCLLFSKPVIKQLPLSTLQKFRIPAVFSALLLAGASGLHLTSAYMYTTKVAITPNRDLLQTIDDTLQTPWLWYDQQTGAHRTRQIIAALNADIFAYLDQDKMADPQKCANAILTINDFLRKKIPRGSSIQSLSIALNSLSKISTHPRTKDLMQGDSLYEKAWQETVADVRTYMPYRTDLLVPYMTHLLTTPQWAKLETLCQDILETTPHDPIALWYLGTLRLQDDTTYEKGICLMKKAIDFHIDGYIPLPQSQIDQILQGAQGIMCY